MMRRGWVLVTDGGGGQGRSALAAVRALAEGGYPVAVSVSGSYSLAASSRFCGRKVQVPLVSDASRYKQAILDETRARPYLTVMPTSDAALLAMGMPVRHLVDKMRLNDVAQRAGLGIPETREFGSPEEMTNAEDELEYPVVVKPSLSRWPAALIRSSRELRELARRVHGEVLVQPFLGADMRAVCGVVWQGRLTAVSHQRYHRIWPAFCGTASAAETITPDLELEERVTQLLSGYNGIFQAQLAAGKLLDLNARPYGSMPLAVAAGTNLPRIYCDLLHGVGYESVLRARPGVFYRWVEGDLRSAWASYRRGEMGLLPTLRAVKPHRNAAHSTESILDPKPAVARLAYALRRAR